MWRVLTVGHNLRRGTKEVIRASVYERVTTKFKTREKVGTQPPSSASACLMNSTQSMRKVFPQYAGEVEGSGNRDFHDCRSLFVECDAGKEMLSGV